MTVNPQPGTVDAVAQHLLDKHAQSIEPENVEEPQVTLEDDGEPEALEPEIEEIEEEHAPDDEQVDSPEDTEDEFVEEPLHTIKVNGEEFEVTLEEALKGHMLERDYRKKTADLSEERKALDAEKERVNSYLQAEQQVVQELEILKELNSKPIYSESQLMQILEEKGNTEYLKAKAQEERRQKNLSEIRARMEAKQSVLTGEQTRAQEALVAREQEALYNALPHVKEPEGQANLVKFLTQDFGFKQEEIESTVDHRLFVLADESRKYREIMAKSKPKSDKKPPKVIKRKARKDQPSLESKRVQDLKRKAQKSGRPDDMAAYLRAKRKPK